MNKWHATLIVVGLAPLVLPIAVTGIICIAGCRLIELWYRAWQELKF